MTTAKFGQSAMELPIEHGLVTNESDQGVVTGRRKRIGGLLKVEVVPCVVKPRVEFIEGERLVGDGIFQLGEESGAQVLGGSVDRFHVERLGEVG